MDGKLAQLYIIFISDKCIAHMILTFFFSSYLSIFYAHKKLYLCTIATWPSMENTQQRTPNERCCTQLFRPIQV